VAIFLLLGASIAYASHLYSPGQTLDPTCLPTNPDCTVSATLSPVVGYITATSTTATSTFAGGINVGGAINSNYITHTHQIYAIGDSITWLNATATSYPSVLNTLLGSNWTVTNLGVNGDLATFNIASRMNEVINPGNAEYVIILAGTNDITNGVSSTTLEASLQTMYTAAHNAGIKVVALTLTPRCNSVNWGGPQQTILSSVNSWILNNAVNVDYGIDLYSQMVTPGDCTMLAAYDGGDHLHPNATGASFMANYMQNNVSFAANPTYNYGHLTVSGLNNYIDQSLSTADTPTFNGLNVNGNTFVINNKDNSIVKVVSIGTTTASAKLTIQGNGLGQASKSLFVTNSAGTPTFTVNDYGQVQIGTSSPSGVYDILDVRSSFSPTMTIGETSSPTNLLNLGWSSAPLLQGSITTVLVGGAAQFPISLNNGTLIVASTTSAQGNLGSVGINANPIADSAKLSIHDYMASQNTIQIENNVNGGTTWAHIGNYGDSTTINQNSYWSSANGGYKADDATKGASMIFLGTGQITFKTGTVGSSPGLNTAMVINSYNSYENNIGIGTASPNAKVDISPTVYTSTTTLKGVLNGLVYNSATPTTNYYAYYISTPTGTGTITNKYALVTEAGAGSVGIGTTSPFAKLSIMGTANGTTPLFAIATTTGSATTTVFQIDQNGVITENHPNATSTINGNLYVNGTLRSTNSYVGDLIFANGFRFTETPLNGTPQGLLLENQNGSTALSVDENGNLTVPGDICANGAECWGKSIDNINQNLDSLASSTALSILSVQATTTKSLSDLSASFDILNQNVSDLSGRLNSLASSTLALSSLSTSTVASTTALTLSADQSFIQTIANAVQNLIQSAGNWVVNQITAVTGVFTTKVQTPLVETQQLCVGSTCVTEDQLKQLLQKENVAAVIVSTPALTVTTTASTTVVAPTNIASSTTSASTSITTDSSTNDIASSTNPVQPPVVQASTTDSTTASSTPPTSDLPTTLATSTPTTITPPALTPTPIMPVTPSDSSTTASTTGQ
jgi:lysophospholipase L1-like esterase